MKKISILAMAALFLAACNQDGQTIIEDEGGNALLFNASTNVTTTRATYGAINTNALMASADGFGVFAYHNGETVSPAVETESKAANFMFNQQVRYTGSWTYSPVKYWPNETGTNAESTDAESLSFLAYAPWISANDAANNKTAKSGGIVGITENTTAFDKIAIDYQVAQDPQKQVDLLWGVGDGTEYSDVEGNTNTLTDGLPLYNLFKPSTSYKVPFLFKHALSKLNLNIDAYVDAVNSNTNPVANGTKIFVRQVTFDGNLATEGTLLLKNTEAGEPLWKAIGGTDALAAAPLVLNDGREKDKEATTEKADETFACLNPMIIQKGKAFGADATEVGVTNATVSLLTPAEDGTASLMVIPVKVADPAATSTMKVTIVYDVLTFDENLGVDLKDDSQQKGSTVTNVITKTIDGFAFEAGKEYTINMHLGMNSVKFDASVSDWEGSAATPIDLPSNGEASNQNTVNEQTLPGILTAAANYPYTDHTHKGSFSISGTVVNYSIAASVLQSDQNAIMNDVARMLGGLYRQTSGTQITEIEYDGTTYVWDENGPNKGSNWTSSIPCTQATSLVTALVTSMSSVMTTGSASVTLKLNGTSVTCNIEITGMP